MKNDVDTKMVSPHTIVMAKYHVKSPSQIARSGLKLEVFPLERCADNSEAKGKI